ncbi:MAG: hypothetical protein OXC08_10590 [Thiotrichales bacterium]|nr:hypothetical protein [Thiotrichales bacterium]
MESTRLHREMTITHAEFLRSLVPAVAPATFTLDGLRISVIGAPGKVEITLSEERERRIALLRLPVVDVGIELSGFEPEALERFLAQFDRSFQRGGG